MNDRNRIGRIEGEPASARQLNGGRPLAWILAAFGLLLAGVAGGTALYAWRSDIGWTVPIAGFAAYLFAFRRGMILWNPEIDRTWRQYLWVKPGVNPRKDAPDPDATIRLLPPDPQQPPRSALKVVR
jgi:hypothetical protein